MTSCGPRRDGYQQSTKSRVRFDYSHLAPHSTRVCRLRPCMKEAAGDALSSSVLGGRGALADGAISGATLFGSAAFAVADQPNCACRRPAIGCIRCFGCGVRTSMCGRIWCRTNFRRASLKGRATMWCATTRRTTSTPTPRYKLTFKASVSLWSTARLGCRNRHCCQREPLYFLEGGGRPRRVADDCLRIRRVISQRLAITRAAAAAILALALIASRPMVGVGSVLPCRNRTPPRPDMPRRTWPHSTLASRT